MTVTVGGHLPKGNTGGLIGMLEPTDTESPHQIAYASAAAS